MKRFLPFLLIALVASAALGTGAWLLRAKRQQAEQLAAATSVLPADGSKPGAKSPPIRGDAKAKVTIEEFADFQCPPCARFSVALHNLEQEYHGRVRLVFRHYPLTNHQKARPAALAAEAAALQGKFWEMHDFLYKNQSAWSTVADVGPLFTTYATAIGLDSDRFIADMAKPELDARVSADQERATSRGVTQTPTLFVNNELVPAKLLSAEGIRAAIEKALAPSPVTP